VPQRGEPVLEPDQIDEVDGQPDQPGGEPAEPEPADAGNRAEREIVAILPLSWYLKA
jgi:hypothetical protein